MGEFTRTLLTCSPRGLCYAFRLTKKSCLCESSGDVHDSGLTGFDEHKIVVHGTIWLGQLSEHLINEIVEKDFGGLIKYSPKGYCMIGVQFCKASYSLWICCGRIEFTDFDIIFVELGN